MADPSRRHPDPNTDPAAMDPRMIDPSNPVPPREGQRFEQVNRDPRVNNRAIVENQTRGAGTGVMIAIIALILAAIAYFMLAPSAQGPGPVAPPAATVPDTTAPAAPAAPAPDAMAPAAPAAPEPAPAAPAPAPAAQ